jgi:hypothetical protein
MPKPTDTAKVCIGANGLENQAGRQPKTLDIKVLKAHQVPELADAHNRMAELAAKKKALDTEG